jgi:phenylalanyl-tRNA synthetase beta chain
MLLTVKNNYDNAQKNVWLYEVGKTYFKENEATQTESGVKETLTLSGIITGNINNNLWIKKNKTDFYTIKGIIESLFETFGLENRIRLSAAENIEYIHPGRSAKITILGKTPATLGYFGEIYPILKDKLKINQDIYLFEIDLDMIIESISKTPTRYKKLPQFPEVQRDIAFAIGENITHEQISNVIKKSANSKLFNISSVFDIYQGEHIEKGFKSMAYRINCKIQTQRLLKKS